MNNFIGKITECMQNHVKFDGSITWIVQCICIEEFNEILKKNRDDPTVKHEL